MTSAPQTTAGTTDVRVTGNGAAEQEAPGHGSTVCADCTDGLGKPRPIEPGSFRERVHSNPAVALTWRVAVFTAGLLLVMLGIALTVLPGPLTIPPVLAGLWVWSTEFDWARRFFAVFRRKAVAAWRHARQHPVSSLAVTVGGLAAAAAVLWAVGHFQLVDRATAALGL
ncbi:PGPGW domain-containing protein [Blastococcus saxobsidens]|uniref:Putative transmembrane protein PGPGW n=1 Tax=Blastococcus saxobsidens TaxID=138336 RepID=A0A4Q7Y8F6_9ACTN|nr:PGPGW domain-containing protein [Blastococcus saxobsidens]RZU32411.1 putative transmembrane protein PGPGW [Blastococcus saxobsidens]